MRYVKVKEKLIQSIFHCLLMHVSYCYIRLSYTIFPFALLLLAQSSNPAQYNWKHSQLLLLPNPSTRSSLEEHHTRNSSGIATFSPLWKTVILKIWGEVGLAENHTTVAIIFLPLPFPAAPGVISKSREMCKAHLQHDSHQRPEFWADKDRNSCK